MVCPADSVGKKGNKSCKPHRALLPTQWGLGQRAEHQHWDFSQICSCQKPPLPNDSYLKKEKSKDWMGNLARAAAWLIDLSLKNVHSSFLCPIYLTATVKLSVELVNGNCNIIRGILYAKNGPVFMPTRSRSS